MSPQGDLPLPDDGCVDVVEGDGDADRLVFHHIDNVGLVNDHWGLLNIGTWRDQEHISVCNTYCPRPGIHSDGLHCGS